MRLSRAEEHARLVNRTLDELGNAGFRGKPEQRVHPNLGALADLLCTRDDTAVVVEVKALTRADLEPIGQAREYARLYQEWKGCKAVAGLVVAPVECNNAFVGYAGDLSPRVFWATPESLREVVAAILDHLASEAKAATENATVQAEREAKLATEIHSLLAKQPSDKDLVDQLRAMLR